VFTVTGAGADIWGTVDAFHYTYKVLNGDGTIVARVSSLNGPSEWTKVGVMMRQTLEAGSAQAMMFVSGSNGYAFQRRAVTGGTTTHSAGGGGTAPVWVRLTRADTDVTAWVSTDGGQNWRWVGRETMSFSGAIYVGLAVTSHDSSSSATGVFDSVTISQ